MKIEPKSKPKRIREWIAWRLVDLAKWIWPKNEAALSFFMERVMEAEMQAMLYGESMVEFKVRGSTTKA